MSRELPVTANDTLGTVMPARMLQQTAAASVLVARHADVNITVARRSGTASNRQLVGLLLLDLLFVAIGLTAADQLSGRTASSGERKYEEQDEQSQGVGQYIFIIKLLIINNY